MTKALLKIIFLMLTFGITAIGIADPINVTESPSGIRDIVPSSTQSPVYINDGITSDTSSRAWLSRPGTMHNNFEFTVDRQQDGLTGELGDINDIYQLESIALYVPGTDRSLKEFIIEAQNNHGAWQRIFSSQTLPNPYNFAKSNAGGIRAVIPSSSSWSPSKINDGASNIRWSGQNWLSRPGIMNNTFEFTFDPDLNGTPGEVSDQFTLESVSLYVPGTNRSLKEFIIEAQNNHGAWQRIFSSQSLPNPYNFAKSNAGGIRAVVPSSSSWSPSKINDGVSNIQRDGQNWLSRPGIMNNTFEFTFDPDLNGTPGEVSDQFTLESVSLYLPGTNRSLKNFEIAVETTAGWQPAISLQAAMIVGKQSFPIGPFTNVLRVRLTTLNNYGDTHLQINEFEVNGNWKGHNPFFVANKSTGKQIFDFTAPANNDGRLNNITRLRLNTISNYGDTFQQVNEFEVNGNWNGHNPFFIASKTSGKQFFDLTATPANNDGRLNNITRLRFNTISNYGDHYQQVNEFQAFGIINKRLTGGFNAFDSATAPTAISGSLQTRIASNNTINFDVIALNTDKSAVDTNFTNDVKVELLANMASVASDSNNCPVSSTVISTLAATTIINGRSTVAMPAVNNVWKDVAIRITYQPPTGALITTCAIDRFAIRPAAFTLTAQHNDWQTAGNNEAINTASSNSSPIHKAGRMFSLQIKAVDSAGTIMSNYADIPVIASNYPSLLSPATGVLGTLELGSLTNVKGVIDSHTAKYSEVGAITLKMIDEDFAGIDASDGTSLSARTISSAEAIIGRFIPDHFKVTTVTNGLFENACSGFSYNGQSFSYQTAPEINVSAYNSDNIITQNYTGNFAKLTVNDFSISVANHDAIQLGKDGVNLIRINRNAAPVSLNDNSDGSLSFSFGNDLFTHLHDNNSLVAPYSNSLNINITSITDSDDVTTQSLPHLLQVTGGNIRFGRLVINTAHGSELLPLPVTIKTEYFNGIDWTQNTADQCTVLTPNDHLRLANPETHGGSWQAGDSTMTIANGTSTASFQQITSGQGILTFSAPGEDNYGFINIKGNLSGTYDWLLADTNNDGIYDDPATARASFGVFKGSDTIIFRRELY